MRQPAGGNSPIQIAVAADANFLMPLAVTLRSLARAHSPGEIHVTVVHDDLSASDRARVEDGLAGLQPTWLCAPRERLDGTSYPSYLGRASTFRLLLPELMPAHVDRVIYLDIDIVVTGTLRPLWETDLQGSYVAAVRDAATPFTAGPFGPDWRALGLDPGGPYFNSGVLVVALDAWRAAEIPERALELLRTAPLRWGDQDALNVLLGGRWMELSRRWNLQTPDVLRVGFAWALWREDVERAVAHPAVIHYTDRVKPWHAEGHNPLDGRWYEMLEGTTWGHWRPDDRTRPLYRRVGSRTKSAWRVLTASGSVIGAT